MADDLSRRLLRSVRPRKLPKPKGMRPAPRAGKIAIHLDADVMGQLDAIAERRGMTREQAATDLLCKGLAAMGLAASRR